MTSPLLDTGLVLAHMLCLHSRYKRRLHALWSYLRGTDHGKVVLNLRQKVLQGEISSSVLLQLLCMC